MNKIFLSIAIGTLLSTQAMAITVNGVTWSPADFEQIDSGSFLQNFDTQTNELTGWGFIDSFNNDPSTPIVASGAELTYQFSGFMLDESISSINVLGFSGGTVNIFYDPTADFNINDGTTAGAGADGSLWLSLEGHAFWDITRGLMDVTLGANLSSGTTTLDTASGPAAPYFDTDSIPDLMGGTADFLVSSDVTNYFNAANTLVDTNTFIASVIAEVQTLACAPGDSQAVCAAKTQAYMTDASIDVGDFFNNDMGISNVRAKGSLDMTGKGIPEPATLSLLGLGLLGFATAKRRKTA